MKLDSKNLLITLLIGVVGNILVNIFAWTIGNGAAGFATVPLFYILCDVTIVK